MSNADTEYGFYQVETPWGTYESWECPDCGWNDRSARVRERGECEYCGRSIDTEAEQ